MRKILSYEVREEDLEKTAGGLVNLLLKNCMHLTGHEVSRAKFHEDGITADDVPVTVKQRIHAGQMLSICLEDTAEMESRVVPVEGDVTILYEDEDIVFVDKPSGLVVHPSHGHFFDSVGNYLAYYYEQQGQEVICRVIGRLDKDTSGILLFAKNRAAASRMSKQKQTGESRRRYLALVEGRLAEKQGEIDSPLGKVPGDLLRQQVCEDGLSAHTIYEVVQEFEDYSLVSVEITTGRTHQIRVHMASIGHPLIGDPLYGKEKYGLNRAALHSYEVECLQPFTREAVYVRSPVPEDMAALLERRFL